MRYLLLFLLSLNAYSFDPKLEGEFTLEARSFSRGENISEEATLLEYEIGRAHV